MLESSGLSPYLGLLEVDFGRIRRVISRLCISTMGKGNLKGFFVTEA